MGVGHKNEGCQSLPLKSGLHRLWNYSGIGLNFRKIIRALIR